jgi:hypothetical protein
MAAGLLKRRASGDERLDPASLEKVIAYLAEDPKPTKTAACAMLNIAYNTTRLDKIIEQYLAKKELDAQRRKAKRGTAATIDEISYMVTEYLEGATIDSISKGIYRGADFVKRVLEENFVPLRKAPHDYFKPEIIPDGAVRDRFTVGEKVYSVRYDSLATVRAESTHKDGYVYRVWLDSESTQEFAYQPAWELASLQHLRDKGINI